MQAMFLEQLFYKEDLKANLAIAIEAVKTAIIQFEKAQFLHGSAVATF